jgi:hypothetical protein
MGVVALVVASAASAYASSRLGLNAWWLCLFIPVAAGSLIAGAYVRQLVTGGERLVLIENAVLAGSLVLSAAVLVGQPVPAWSDVTAIGISTFAGIGRIGCLLAGCCYGAPSRIGVVYRHATRCGTPVGVHLFPVQVVESLGLLTVAILAMALSPGRDPGVAMTLTCLIYGVIRSGTEILRGDRPADSLAHLAPRVESVGLTLVAAGFAMVTQDDEAWTAAALGAAVVTTAFALARLQLGRHAPAGHVAAIGSLIDSALDQLPASRRPYRVGPFLVIIGPAPTAGLHVSVSVLPGGTGDAARALATLAIGTPARFTHAHVAHAIYQPRRSG